MLILASQSPRRKELLALAEIEFEIVLPNVVEDYPNDLMPAEVAIHIAYKKATAVQQQSSNYNKKILAADTIVVVNNEILGKPKNEIEAVEMLQKLNGISHEVITGVSLLYNTNVINFYETTQVVFNKLSQQQIEHYVNKYQPFDKAGAYAIQEWIGIVGINKIIGDYYNVMGLPINRVVQELQKL
jgi:septum formation protein